MQTENDYRYAGGVFIPPMRGLKQPLKPSKPPRLLTPCTFVSGPYTAQIRKVLCGEDRLPPSTMKVEWKGYRSGMYRLRPGTTEYVWVTS